MKIEKIYPGEASSLYVATYGEDFALGLTFAHAIARLFAKIK